MELVRQFLHMDPPAACVFVCGIICTTVSIFHILEFAKHALKKNYL